MASSIEGGLLDGNVIADRSSERVPASPETDWAAEMFV
jgi:hypothetical protein